MCEIQQNFILTANNLNAFCFPLYYQYPVMFCGARPVPEKLEALHEALGWLNGFMDGNTFSVGNGITVADLVLISTISTIMETGIDCSKYPNIMSWSERCKTQMIGYDTENDAGAKQYGAFAKSKLNA